MAFDRLDMIIFIVYGWGDNGWRQGDSAWFTGKKRLDPHKRGIYDKNNRKVVHKA
jgi:hypothetical protein